ncbi:MAG: glucose 1-dehydrogenase [Bacteroidota bacterium]
MRLRNKIAIVTGAADGIGLAASRLFAIEGATVVMVDINGEKCLEESTNINTQGGNTRAVTCSVGSTEEMAEMVQQTVADFGRIDVLVNNAAIAIGQNILEMEEEAWDQVIDINLKGVYRGIRQVLPHMIERGAGSIINLSSMQGLRSWDDWTAYATAKGGINALTVQLAGQFGPKGIRINAIAPGAIMTPLNEKRVAEEGEAFLEASIEQSALRRMGRADEVAQTVLFLASDEAPFITGEIIRIDGGLSVLPRYFEER